MGAEAVCTASFKGRTAEGTARLEMDVLQFRSADMRLSIPFKEMSSVTARGGMLSVTSAAGTATFAESSRPARSRATSRGSS